MGVIDIFEDIKNWGLNMKTILKNIFIGIRRMIYILLGIYDEIISKKKIEVFILCYHSIADDNWKFGVNIEIFKRQVDYLKQRFDFITLDNLKEFLLKNRESKKTAIILTFDDGYQSIFKIKNYLKANNISPLLFLIADPENADRKELDNKFTFLDERKITKLVKEKWIIGNHSMTHKNMNNLNLNKLKREIVESKLALEKKYGIKVTSFSYPKGKYSKQILEVLKQSGYQFGLTMDDGYITEKSNLLTLPRIGVDRTHSFEEFKYLMSPSVIQFRKYIKSTFLNKYL